jgi:predicted nucleic-acid-binding protein
VIGIDTNVLVRLLTADDLEQHRVALSFFRERSAADPAYVSSVTLAETFWLLQRRYGLAPRAIVEAFAMLDDSDDFVVEGREAIEAVRMGVNKPAEFVDLLISLLNRAAGSAHTVTFDRRAAKVVPGMELLT